MILTFLLASACALSFAPLEQNDGLTVELSEAGFNAVNYTLAFSITSSSTPTTGEEYKYYIYDAADGGDKLFDVKLKTAKLTGTKISDEIPLFNYSSVLSGRSDLYVDVYRTDISPTSVLQQEATRLAISFGLKPTDVVVEEKDEKNAKLTFTVEGALDTEETTFIWNTTKKNAVEAVEGETNKYTVEIKKTDLINATTFYGYFNGTSFEESSLPYEIIKGEAPTLTLKHHNATTVNVSVPIASGQKAYIKTGDAEPFELTKENEDTHFQMAYTNLTKAAFVYYTDETGIITSTRQVVTPLPTLPKPKLTWKKAAPEASDDTPPSLQIAFKSTDSFNYQYRIIQDDATNQVEANSANVILHPSDLVGYAAEIVCVGENDAPLYMPIALNQSSFNFTIGEEVDGKIQLKVNMTPGCYNDTPGGIIAFVDGEADSTKYFYEDLKWLEDPASNATVSVSIEAFADEIDEDIVVYVTKKYTGALDENPIRLSEKFVVLQKKKLELDETTVVGTGAFFNIVSLIALLCSTFVYLF